MIVGDDEVAQGRVSVKPLRADEPQRLLSPAECAGLLSPKRSD